MILRHLNDGIAGLIEDTPKATPPMSETESSRNDDAIRGAEAEARRQ